MTTQRMPLMDISNTDAGSSPVATGNRRKSGRAVKAPEKFVPDVPSSQAGPASTKRKRGGDDIENDTLDVEEEDDEESDESIESTGEEEVRESRQKPRQAKKPATKRAKVNGAVSREDVPAFKLPNRPKKTGKRVAIADQDAEGLYAEVYTSGDSPDDVASQWLNRYNANHTGAMTELVNFVLKSAGCSLLVTDDDIRDPENVEGRIGDLQEEYQAQNISDYPLISKAKSVHAFRAALIGFFDQLIKAMHESGVMYQESTLIENIHLWVATMTSSPTRPFRHTATVIALAITSSICEVAHQEIENAAKILRQLEGETRKKGGGNKTRLADFQKKVATGQKNKETLENQIKDFFETVYVHRYRDIDPKIRIECAEALGNWILTLHSLFFDGVYLRYMGWTLSDTHGPMRLEVVKQIVRIIKIPHNAGGMRHFIERFRPRLVEMATQDSEPAVRAAAVELMDLIRRAGMLEPDDIDIIGKMIFDTEHKVRRAVVGFFTESIKDLYDLKVEELGGQDVLEDFLTVEDGDVETPRAGWLRLKTLAEILCGYDSDDQSEVPNQIDMVGYLNVSGDVSRFTLAAEVLFEKVPELKDWEMLAGYLLFDHSARATGNETERALKTALKPSELEERVLLEMLNAAVKLNLTQAVDPDKAKEKNKKKSTKLATLEAAQAIAVRLAALIPRLLRKYGADPETAKIVLRLEHVLNLGVFQELRQDSTAYSKLLDAIGAQFNGHADKAVLSEASAAFLHAKDYEELEEVTESKLQSLWEDITNALRKLNKTGEISVRGGFKNKALQDLSHHLARLEQLSSISNSVEPLEMAGGKNDPLPISILLDVVSRGIFETPDETIDALEDDVALSAIRSSMFYFMWKTRALIESVSSGAEISDFYIEELRERQDTFVTNLTAAFSSRATLDPVRLMGAGILLDLYVLFATLRPAQKSRLKKAQAATDSDGTNLNLQSLVKEIGPEVQAELTSIFEGLEKQYAKRSKKKLAEPADDEEPEDFDSEPEDDEEDFTDSERRTETLKAEHQLCELTGKLVFAIIAQVLDDSGPLKGKLRLRLRRNLQRLGPSFKEVVAYLDGPKSKSKKSHKGKAQQGTDAATKTAKSNELVEEEEEDEDPFAQEEPDEGTAEDLRRRELEDEPAASADEDEESAAAEEEDDILGD